MNDLGKASTHVLHRARDGGSETAEVLARHSKSARFEHKLSRAGPGRQGNARGRWHAGVDRRWTSSLGCGRGWGGSRGPPSTAAGRGGAGSPRAHKPPPTTPGWG